jgi:hypothetical protein
MSWRIFAHAKMMAQCPQGGDAGLLMPHIRRRDDDLDWERGTSCRHCRHSSPSAVLNFQTVTPSRRRNGSFTDFFNGILEFCKRPERSNGCWVRGVTD